VLSFRSFGGICETASCLVRELTSPRDVQSASRPVRELAIRELAYPRVVQLPLGLALCRGGHVPQSAGDVGGPL